jgi:homocysteine S-methyltransferase
MPLIPLRDRLNDPAPLLADGAMGTMLHSLGLGMDECFERLNLTDPARVESIHARYLAAGADLIETNTFGANRCKLAEWGLEDQVEAINRAGVAIARAAVQASGREAYVLGSVGPLGIALQPYGRLNPDEARAAFTEQIGALIAAGVDGILCETFTDLAEIEIALAVTRALAPEMPIICELTFTADDRTVTGHLPGRVAHALRAAGADVIGVNCSSGPAQIARVLHAMHLAEPEARLSAMPNAGFPEHHGGRTMYPATTEYFADYTLAFQHIGANIIGGCCGTTPEHIAAMRAALDEPERRPARLNLALQFATPDETEPAHPEHKAREHMTELGMKLAAGQFVVTVEMTPPRSTSFDKLLSAAVMLREAGADVVNIPDSPTARMRVSPWAVGQLIQTQVGIETILHFPTRGRNLLRVQGDLLGAHALGLRNIFVTMGDPTRIGDYPDAMDNFDIPPTGLIRLIHEKLNRGSDQAGNSIGQPTAFTIGCALNMNADDIDKEIELLRKKLDAGADFALAQPVFEPAAVERFLRRYEQIEGHPLRLPVLMGVMPLYSLKHATFLNNEIPGITIPEAILQRIAEAGDDAPGVGVAIARELLADLRGMVQGAYLIPAYGRYELAAQVVDAVHV